MQMTDLVADIGHYESEHQQFNRWHINQKIYQFCHPFDFSQYESN